MAQQVIPAVETPDNLFVAPVTIEIIESFMNEVGYQGVVDKVSSFYTKNLAQPWKTMFKVFNHCLTTRTSGHDQKNINLLQLFYVMINRTNVYYAALLWWDFINNVYQKKEAIQYPRFIKLIIADLINKFLDIPQRVDEDYHSIKDDTPLENIAKVQEKLDEKEIEKMVEEHEKEKKHDNDEKIDEVVMEKDNDNDVEKVDEGVKEKRNADVVTSSM
nr:monodehydroascorbate reductase [Tanacetum cinerariifolium]